MVKYSIHRALAELKLLDKRITKTINNLQVVTCKKGDKLEYNINVNFLLLFLSCRGKLFTRNFLYY